MSVDRKKTTLKKVKSLTANILGITGGLLFGIAILSMLTAASQVSSCYAGSCPRESAPMAKWWVGIAGGSLIGVSGAIRKSNKDDSGNTNP